MLLMEAHMSSGEFAEAAVIARRQAETSGEKADPYYRLGLILSKDGKYDEARTAFEKVLELQPDNLLAINQIVDLEIARKRYDAARALVEGLPATGPGRRSPLPARKDSRRRR